MALVAFIGASGSGKTTCATLLAAHVAARGHRVLLVDADPRGTAFAWSRQAETKLQRPPGAVSIGTTTRALMELPTIARAYPWTIVDTGRLDAELTRALSLVGAVCVAPAASPLHLLDIAEAIEPIHDRLRVLVNRGPSADSDAITGVLRQLSLARLGAALSNSYQTWLSQLELDPDGEMAAVANELQSSPGQQTVGSHTANWLSDIDTLSDFAGIQERSASQVRTMLQEVEELLDGGPYEWAALLRIVNLLVFDVAPDADAQNDDATICLPAETQWEQTRDQVRRLIVDFGLSQRTDRDLLRPAVQGDEDVWSDDLVTLVVRLKETTQRTGRPTFDE